MQEDIEVDAAIEKLGLKQVSDEGEIEKIVDEVLEANADKVAEYKNGKEKLFGFFVGQVMKASRGKANPQIVNKILKSKLS
jgi:aspartyl-tRNA(Asn)/glutamyl-tRNA(Gln) amidotransferase subunit B